ncbi:hypothetical protein BU24DRAFT_424876 [Aaosphaeria arxii CBS 175.79]|uniref:Extracellular membrane protein CFEM domain-containing protein n=1 Tax=Aaosphaeria arxii CBS 175.79 TaxID=1450172 RepID=A0A6A5XL26_9PLEO|nr:uncharacterized protein BU24DRAFT_424876 [Aaosphaeria arxii CBS 175.79]KAF2013842.1 hypothetical protein BU24DRAFT_424876 [Aaosphaeria arxii CBS 175.79]
MFSKTTLFLAFTAVASVVSAASPPGCLLGAVNTYKSPSDISAVCKSKDATSKIQEYCGAATSDALSAFADICNKAGVEVETKISSSTGSAKPTGTGASSAQPSGASATVTTTGGNNVNSPAQTGSASGTSAPTETPGAAGKLEISAAALFAGLGAIAAML